MESERQARVAELVNNEQEYVKELDFIVMDCLPILRQKMNQQELNSIFSNIEVIRSFHQMLSVEFAQQLTISSDKQKIGAIIVKYGDFLKLYKPYCAAQGIPSVLNMEKTKSLKDFFDMKNKGQTLSDLLSKPIQRLAVYPILLKEIIAFTPPKHVDYDSLKLAVSKLEDVQHWNQESTKQSVETSDKLEKLKDVHGSENIQLNGKLIKEDEFDRIKDKETVQSFHYYLFSDMLMTAQHSKALRKGYQLKKVFYYNQTLARDVLPEPASANSTTSNPSHQLEVLDIETCKIYRFGMKSEEEKKEMLRYLQEAIYTQTFTWSEDRSHLFNWFYEGMSAMDPMWDMMVCYRNFQTPLEFLSSIEARLQQQTAGPDHFTVEILHTFMESIKRSDVMDDASWHQLHERLMIAIAHVTNLGAKTYLLQILETLKFVAPKTRRHALKIGDQSGPDKSINRISVSLQRSPSQIHQDKRPGISPKEVAEEITQTEWNILRCVNEWELLNTNWSRSNCSELAPNVLAFIDRFNWTSRWISSKILRRDSPKKRADTITSYIEMGMRFKELHNFNGVMEVLSSLHSTPISRLKETWALLTPQQLAEFQGLTDLMKPDKNSQIYREALSSVDFRQPCMPYLGLFLSDLTFIEEANSKLVNGVINPNYTSLMGAKLRMFKSYQKRKYQLMKPLYSIYGELVFGEEELYKLSKLREDPNAGVNTDVAASRKSMLARSDSRRFQKGSLNAALGEDDDIAVEKFLSKRDWQILLANAEAITLKKDDVLVHATDASSNLFLVNAGMLKLVLRDGRTLDVAPGEVCSKTSMIGDHAADTVIASVVSSSESTVSAINLTFLFRLFETEFDLAARFFKYVANQLNNMLRQAMASYAKGSQVNHRRSVSLSVDPSAATDSDKLFSTNFKSLGNEVVVKCILAGQLYITKNYLCFNAKAFGLNKRKIIHLSHITDLKNVKGVLEVYYDLKKGPKKLTFRNDKELEDCQAITLSLWESARSRQAQSTSRTRSESAGGSVTIEEKEREKGFLTPDDWKLILKGTKCVTYEPGVELITEGVRPGALYQIVKGVCSIQVKTGERSFSVIASRKEVHIFGELSFLDEEQAASASVVTDTPVEIYVLDYNYVHIMLSVYKYLAPRFYKYIARLLWERMVQFLNRTVVN